MYYLFMFIGSLSFPLFYGKQSFFTNIMFKDFKLRTIKKLLTLDLKIEHCSEKIQLAIQCFQRSINMQKKEKNYKFYKNAAPSKSNLCKSDFLYGFY